MTVKSALIGCVVLAGWLMAGQVFAACTPPAVAGEEMSACKDWPAYPGLTISASTRFEPGTAKALAAHDLDLSVLQDGQPSPIASFHQRAAFVMDGARLQELTLDTARYKLTPELRAFGVRARLTNGSRLNPMEEVQLSLYVKEGEKLRPALRKLVVYEYGGEWDDNCAGERFEISRTVDMAKTTSHGFADLIVKTQETGTTNVVEGDACEDKTTVHTPVLTTLHYDGKTYVLPPGFKGL
ncbi:hypothetical protein ACIQVE_10490 [Pseudomonas sp. NPDC098747]|uniref:hypothetical protein n=1 Tax=Pseudomonas sp. NPDC098747 TaxID=3364487 RepID=UPI00383A52CC